MARGKALEDIFHDTPKDIHYAGRNILKAPPAGRLLQGRNFSDRRARCPFHRFQQDGHMSMRNPVGRANRQRDS